MAVFQNRKYRAAGASNGIGARYRTMMAKRPFLLFGLPFMSVIVAASFVLTPATAIRYERHDRKVRQMTREEELGVGKQGRKVDIREEYYVRFLRFLGLLFLPYYTLIGLLTRCGCGTEAGREGHRQLGAEAGQEAQGRERWRSVIGRHGLRQQEAGLLPALLRRRMGGCPRGGLRGTLSIAIDAQVAHPQGSGLERASMPPFTSRSIEFALAEYGPEPRTRLPSSISTIVDTRRAVHVNSRVLGHGDGHWRGVTNQKGRDLGNFAFYCFQYRKRGKKHRCYSSGLGAAACLRSGSRSIYQINPGRSVRVPT